MHLFSLPLDIWQYCILEYMIGPIHQVAFQTNDEIMKFKNLTCPKIWENLTIENVKAVHKLCKTISKHTSNLLLVDDMDEFWHKVSNMLEVAVYWKRYQSFEGFSLARGDVCVEQAVPIVKMQKLIEAVEMISNREYGDIIDRSMCSSYYNDDLDLEEIPNDFVNEEVNKSFIERVQKLLISNSKFEKIKQVTQLDPYDLFLHKAIILSLDMVSYFDSERNQGENHSYYNTLEKCCLISKGLFSDNFMETKCLGLIIDLGIGYSAEDLTVFEEIYSGFVAVSINYSSEYLHVKVPEHAQYLCFSFSEPNETEYERFLEGQDELPNVRDLTIKFPSTSHNHYYSIDTANVEKNILSAITRKRFPKLLRLSIQGYVTMENLKNYEIFSELLYVEIINSRRGANGYDIVRYWSERTVHNFIRNQFIEKDNSLIHQLVLYANICRNDPDADHDSIKEYYELSKEKFVPCISHSSINEYYDRCYE